MPSLSVVQTEPSRRRKDAPADSSPPKPDRAVEQSRHEPLEPDRHLDQPSAQVRRHPVDHRRRHQRLADRRLGGPAGARAEQVLDRHRQEVVGVHQPAVGGDDAVPVGVGVVAGRDRIRRRAAVRPEAHPVDQRGHGVGRGAVHPDLAVPVQGHEPPGRVDQWVDHGQVEPVPLGDGPPVVDRRPAQRVGADAAAPASRIASMSSTFGRSST